MPDLFQGPEGGLRILVAIVVVGVGACVSSDPDASDKLLRVAHAVQPFSGLMGSTQACFRMCSYVQSGGFELRAVDRCNATRALCDKAVAEVTEGHKPVIGVAGFAITCEAALLAACQSTEDCAAFGEHQCQEACVDAWPYELACARDGHEP